MSAQLPGEATGSNLADEDTARIDEILTVWFGEQAMSAPQIDQRMDVWFGQDPAFDHDIKETFADDVEKASAGELDHWADEPRGRLALILLLDQFRRNIHRGTVDAFSMDRTALRLCVEGAMAKKDRGLMPIQQAFFYMPLQHAESGKVQAKSVAVFQRLAEAVSPTYRETFETFVTFAELHHDIIEQFGRFPHRNKLLNRRNTPDEDEYLSGDSPDFGQSS